MGCHTLCDRDTGQACFYSSTTGVAFGPVMESYEVAEAFLQWLPLDPRQYGSQELIDQHAEFTRLFVCECGNLRDDTECETRAFAIAPDGCTCPNNGAADCPWCEAKSIAETAEPEAGERFACSRCLSKKANATKELRHA